MRGMLYTLHLLIVYKKEKSQLQLCFQTPLSSVL